LTKIGNRYRPILASGDMGHGNAALLVVAEDARFPAEQLSSPANLRRSRR
jgi:hypothetical protein